MEQPITLITVLKELHNISGFRISIHNTEFDEVLSYPEELSGFCRFLQRNPQARALCLKNDADAFCKVKQTGQTAVYRCQFGLYEAVAPLYEFGILSGYLMMGQGLEDDWSSRQHILSASLPYTQEREELERKMWQLPVSSQEKILSCVNLLRICGEYITLANRLQLHAGGLAQEVKRYLQNHFSEKLSIEQLCQRFHCSKATLMNSYKKEFGVTVNRYLNQIRLKHGVKLLEQTELPVFEIAEQCGFADQNYFSKVFLKSYHLTPSNYRRQKRPTDSQFQK